MELSWLLFSCVLGRKEQSRSSPFPLPFEYFWFIALIFYAASKSIPLDKARQALLDDIIALYSCEPTIERVEALYTWLRIWWSVCICKWSVGGFFRAIRCKGSSPSRSYKNGRPVVCSAKTFQKRPRTKATKSFAATTKYSNSRMNKYVFAQNSVSYRLEPTGF